MRVADGGGEYMASHVKQGIFHCFSEEAEIYYDRTYLKVQYNV